MLYSKSKKMISMLIIFVIVFSYLGQTLEAIATTDGLSAITNGFLNQGEMKFKSYFQEEKNTQNVANVNEKATLTLEITPNDIGKGFLKEGTITADNDANFKFSKINNITIDETEEKAQSIEAVLNPNENSVTEELEETQESEKEIQKENTTENNVLENITAENQISQQNRADETQNIISTTEENAVANEIPENWTKNEITSRSSQTREIEENNFVSEEEVIQDKIETYEELTAKDFETEIISNNQIKIQNVIYNTKIEVEIEYNKKENFNIADLYKQVNLQLKGTYINIDLEKLEIEQNQQILIGWKYNKEIELTAEYTQVSPFKLGDHTGTIVESKIILKRETKEENYLPIKQTILEIDVPDYNQNAPETVSIQASKLMATKGQDLGEVIFNQENWNYDANNKKLTITVTNENEGTATNSVGEDEYIIVYRYKDYIEQNVTMTNNIKATVEEYSSNENVFTTKELHNSQEIQTQENDLITYNLGTTIDKLNKAKINANYNSQEAIYESEFTSTVNINILTSDLVEEFKINASKELYLDGNATEFDATSDIYYNKLKFNYAEIKNILQNDASIEIQTLTGNLLYTLTADTIPNEEACEIKLASKEKGLYIIFKNVTVNGNVSLEFTKGIGKSNYTKEAFNTFKQIKSCVSAELKYKNFNETYQMAEISTIKELENSKTIAELNLTNENLTTVAKNDNVELRIALNNDKQNTDLYINPTFELVFPKYIKNVTVQSINLIYENGLRIEDFQTYIDNEMVKMRIQLIGIQTTFCESVITNGTNILLNLNIELDEYTPKKQDQIKLYYCNEGVTNYESQTKWTIGKEVPSGILKDTNGFDVSIINYKAPNGFITANSFINYDGQSSKIKSISQGERTARIAMNPNTQIATMELIAMNNTENQCTDAVFIGRIPFKGNKSVITGKNLGTTTNVKILGEIQENIQNPNMATIYYSTNEKATSDLNDTQNNWTTNATNPQDIKSYMIIVKGEIIPGTILKYTYDFEIPADLYYDEAIFGSFGGYYNNHHDTVVSYESTEADKVGLLTQTKPNISEINHKQGLNMVVYPFGENDNLYYGQIVTLTTKVVNNTNEDITNATLKVSLPTGTIYVEQRYTGEAPNVRKYEDITDIDIKEFEIGNLPKGSVREFKFEVRILDNNQDMTRLTGYAQLNDIVYNYEWRAKKAKMSIYAETQDIKSYHEGSEIIYLVDVKKQNDKIIRDLKLDFKLPDYVQVTDIQVGNQDTYKSVIYNTQDRITTAEIGQLTADEKNIKIHCKVNGLNAERTINETIFNVYESEQKDRIYSSNVIKTNTEKIFVEVTQAFNSNEFNYKDLFEYRLTIQNKSALDTEVEISNYFPDTIYFEKSYLFVNEEEKQVDLNNNFLRYETLPAGGKIEIVVIGEVIDWKGYHEEEEILNTAKVIIQKTREEITSNEVNIKIYGDPKTNHDNFEEGITDDEEAQDPIQQEEAEQANQYSISGNVYVDTDANGLKTDEDKTIKSQVQVQLLKGSNMIKATTTDSLGNYTFSNLESGDYSIVYHYDKETYMLPPYTQQQTNEVSKVMETEEGTSVTDNITLNDSSIENLNTGLQEKEKFDFEIKQYVESSIVNVKGEEILYNYNDLELAKIEMDPSELKHASIKLKYKIIVTNVGNVEGQVTSIVDYLPNGLIFDQAENEDWTIGVIKENIYYDGLKGIDIAPGESQEITLILNKKMTEDNTGIISNKVQIAYTESSTRLTEAISGNFATQETIVTITQGRHTGLKVVISTISFAGIVGLFGYMIKTGRFEKKFNGKKWIKKVYK